MSKLKPVYIHAAGLIGAFVGSCSSPQPPASVSKLCTSESGLSRFYMHLDIGGDAGTFRYQFFGQEIIYRVSGLTVEGTHILGAALFDRSATGEVRATPVNFDYDYQLDTLQDGAVDYRCQDLEDLSLLDLPES